MKKEIKENEFLTSMSENSLVLWDFNLPVSILTEK